MKIAIMQPYFFPYIGYFQLINSVDRFIIFDDVNYIKKGWINRNRILLNGSEHLFTLPVKNASQNKYIKEIMLDDPAKWKSKFTKTLVAAYKKTPNFEPVLKLITNLLDINEYSLSKFVTNSIKGICSYLNIKTRIVETSSVYNTINLKKDDKIISICKQENAQEYINPIGGKDLYSEKLFRRKGISIKFHLAKEIIYKQNINTFIPNLSIIDMLMYNNHEFIISSLNQYELL